LFCHLLHSGRKLCADHLALLWPRMMHMPPNVFPWSNALTHMTEKCICNLLPFYCKNK
jgi:hypothetical protein